MTCDRVWRNCFFKHINLPIAWRSKDADLVKPCVQDIFWIECTTKEVSQIIAPLIRDEVHLNRVREAAGLNFSDNVYKIVRGLHFLSTRWGTFVQYYPFMTFDEAGSAWQTIKTIEFENFGDLEKLYPKILPSGVP